MITQHMREDALARMRRARLFVVFVIGVGTSGIALGGIVATVVLCALVLVCCALFLALSSIIAEDSRLVDAAISKEERSNSPSN